MGDMAEVFKDMRDHKKRLREKHGVPCPLCQKLQPRRQPTILLPGKRCRVDGHADPRPELTDEEWSNA